MRKVVLAVALSFPSAALADQAVLDACIASWGKKSPFRKGTPADGTIGNCEMVRRVGGTAE